MGLGTVKLFDLPRKPQFGDGKQNPNFVRNFFILPLKHKPKRSLTTLNCSKVKVGYGGDVIVGPPYIYIYIFAGLTLLLVIWIRY